MFGKKRTELRPGGRENAEGALEVGKRVGGTNKQGGGGDERKGRRGAMERTREAFPD